MAAVYSFFIILVISMLILQVAAEILRLTGLSRDVATFQARSAFTGTGFTTKESELIMNHPVRRKVISSLMFVRNVGFITVLSSLLLSFLSVTSTNDILLRVAFLGGGSLLFFILSKIKVLDHLLNLAINIVVRKWTKIHVHDYESLLNLAGEFEVSECIVQTKSWLADKALLDLRLPDEGILILGVKRMDGYFIGTPRSTTIIYPGDRVVLYGREDKLLEISRRPAGAEGDLIHLQEIKRQQIMEGKPLVKPKRATFLGKLFGKSKK